MFADKQFFKSFTTWGLALLGLGFAGLTKYQTTGEPPTLDEVAAGTELVTTGANEAAVRVSSILTQIGGLFAIFGLRRAAGRAEVAAAEATDFFTADEPAA